MEKTYIVIDREIVDDLRATLAEFKRELIETRSQNEKLHRESGDEFLTPSETAKILKISKATVYNWINKGILKPRDIGNEVRFMRSDIMAAVKPRRG